MRIQKLKTAIEEAQQFLVKAERLCKEHTEAYTTRLLANTHFTGRIDYTDAPAQSAAIKRSSMDLTKALADLRKPN